MKFKPADMAASTNLGEALESPLATVFETRCRKSAQAAASVVSGAGAFGRNERRTCRTRTVRVPIVDQ